MEDTTQESAAPDDYEAFIEAKRVEAPSVGIEVALSDISEHLFPFQRAIVQWALRKGRAAIFAAFGLGKSRIQIELLRIICAVTGGRCLIIAPLGVRQEFRRDAQAMGVEITFIRRIDECDESGIYLTNYETIRDGKLDPRLFTGVSLDEASCLRGFGGTKTFREFMAVFEGGQVPYSFVATATPCPNEYIEMLAYAAFLDVMEVGEGKAQPLDAKVLTPTGWTTMGALRVGDPIIAGDGSVTRVLAVHPQGDRPVFKVTFSDGASTEADGEHLWLTRTQYDRNNEQRYVQRNGADAARVGQFATTRTTAEIASSLEDGKGGKNHSIPIMGAVRFDARAVAIDPWLLGMILGDGCVRETNVSITTADAWVVDAVALALPSGLVLRQTTDDGITYSVTTTGAQGGRGPGSNVLLNALRGYGLLGKRSWEKRIPEDYLFNAPEVRIAMLRGLMDADGTASDRGYASLSTSSEDLANDVVALVRSLGGLASYIRRDTHYTDGDERIAGRDSFIVTITLPAGINPFSLPRKAEKVVDKGARAWGRYIVSVEPAGTKPAQCIAIEHASRLYVTDDFIVTHNTRFFQRDSTNADNLALHPHKTREFWLWMASWALFVTKPSDLGAEYSDDGYELPPMEIYWHEVATDHAARRSTRVERSGQVGMFADASLGVVDASREKRDSLPSRMAKMLEIREIDPKAHRLLWHDTEAEREAIEAALPMCRSVYGSQDWTAREANIVGFSDGSISELATKPVLSGSGCNFQRHCAWSIYVGIGFKFNDWIQSVHRTHRFLQTKPVRIDMIYTEAERGVREVLETKWEAHKVLVANMVAIVREYGLTRSAMREELAGTVGLTRVEASGEKWAMVNNDCVLETRHPTPGGHMADNSVHLIATSIPFGNQYRYSTSFNDFGHTNDAGHFFRQMDYLTPGLKRVLQPGRIMAVHVKDRVVPGGMTGLSFQTIYAFHSDCIRHYISHGFAFMGMITVATDVVRENNATYRLGYTAMCKDGSRMGAGMPEYVLLFRKPQTDRSRGFADVPVKKDKAEYSLGRWQVEAAGFWRSSGDRLLTPQDFEGLPHDVMFKVFRGASLSQVSNHENHVALNDALAARKQLPVDFALLQPQAVDEHEDGSVWTSIARMRTLNGEQTAKGRQNHICPMQFDVADRIIGRWSMKGETVYDPFAGIGTVPMRAVKMGRRGLGTELNPVYFKAAAGYCRAAEKEGDIPTLFDLEPTADMQEPGGPAVVAAVRLDAISPIPVESPDWGPIAAAANTVTTPEPSAEVASIAPAKPRARRTRAAKLDPTGT